MMQITMQTTRTAFESITPTGKEEVGVPDIARLLGLETESQRNVVRRQLREMEKRGESTKLRQGFWRRNIEWKAPRRGDGYVKMWRAMRCQSSTWTVQDITTITRTESNSVHHYLRHLEDSALVARAGKDGAAVLWRLTTAGREHRETPWPPSDVVHPYNNELKAAFAIAQALAVGKVEGVRAQRDIRRHLGVLLARFKPDTNETATELENTSKEEESWLAKNCGA